LEEPDWIGGAGRAGRRPKLDGAQLKQVDEALRQGAQAHGFGTDLWTLPRVAAVIKRVTGVHYPPGHVWKLLAALKWSLQRVRPGNAMVDGSGSQGQATLPSWRRRQMG
jgi:transposase